MKTLQETYDVVVTGGGMAGFCAAIAAARNGAKTCLIQDRPVLGGNASSEVRVTIHGAACHHTHARETGIIGEAMQAERRSNHLFPIENGWTNSVHDMALYDIAVKEPNLTLHLNTSVRDVQLEDGSWGLENLAQWPVADDRKGYLHRPACHDGLSIKAIRAEISNAETTLLIAGKTFIDCTGDALTGNLAGCEWRWGSEAHKETGEVHAVAEGSTDVMGNSIHIRCIDTGRPAPFKAPDWAVKHEDASYFYEQGRKPNEPEGGFWWIEIGVPYNTIYDNEEIRHELTRHALGGWDWMKNKDPKMMDKCRNYALEFIGQVPGKRESRRIMGKHLIFENELQDRVDFPDECAYGGWFIDLHTPGGLLADSSEPASKVGYDDKVKEVALKYIGPYGIPLRAMISNNVPNLLMAGRNISTTHAALGTVRVMATCGLMGQGIGTLAALAIAENTSPEKMIEENVDRVQQQLLRDGCYLPHRHNTDPSDLALKASANASSEHTLRGMGAWEEPEDKNLREHIWRRAKGRTFTTDNCPCEWLHLDGAKLERLGVHLVSTAKETTEVTLRFRKVDSIWAYGREEGELIWEKTIAVPAGNDECVWTAVGCTPAEAGCHRLEVEGPESVAVRWSARQEYGLAGGHLIGSGRFHWDRLPGHVSCQLEPAQKIYNASQVLSGVTRPREQTNLWLSDPGAPLPQWASLEWAEETTFQRVELTFPSQLVLETHWENPFYVAPHIPLRYRLQVKRGEEWKTLCQEGENDRSRRTHILPEPVTTKQLRVVVEETHGAASAGLTEIRVYADPEG
ncbi:MAG: FAD-dependent oxidoreductase [Opitutales bacterium]|nr:FAD-dependent oxidoreductase [Opitutales bacterium]